MYSRLEDDWINSSRNPNLGSLLNVVVYPPREHLALQAVECLSAREFLKRASLKRKKFTGSRTRPFPACSAKVRLGRHTTSVCSTTSDIEPIFVHPEISAENHIWTIQREYSRCPKPSMCKQRSGDT